MFFFIFFYIYMYILICFNFLQIGGASLDVFEEEPPKDPITLELIQHPRVIATPHLGFYHSLSLI